MQSINCMVTRHQKEISLLIRKVVNNLETFKLSHSVTLETLRQQKIFHTSFESSSNLNLLALGCDCKFTFYFAYVSVRLAFNSIKWQSLICEIMSRTVCNIWNRYPSLIVSTCYTLCLLQRSH